MSDTRGVGQDRSGASGEAAALLSVKDLDAHYGPAHILQGVEFEMGDESVAIVGRNGMGKTTLCAAIMGMMPSLRGSARGSIRFRGRELLRLPQYKIAETGIGYVPQGRRLFPSLTVDEHLRIATRRNGDRWTVDKVYELFPRLAERRKHRGAQLSGGEQQMLAIGRALLTNPTLLIMDEPSEGLAPTVVENLIATFRTLQEEGLRILLIEQNLGVATSLAERQLIMVGGQIATEMIAERLASDAEAQRRYLGVEALARAH
jgi:branched-chain amino acid transport system ATP-binding protein